MSAQNRPGVVPSVIAVLSVAAALWPASAWACIGSDEGFDPLSIPLYVTLLLIIAGAALCRWLKHRYFTGRGGKLWARLFVASAVLLGVMLGLFGSFALPVYRQVFESFGADLPAPTILVFGIRHFLWLPVLVVLLLVWTRRDHAQRATFFGWVSTVEICLLAIVVWAMYLPIFKLGCV